MDIHRFLYQNSNSFVYAFVVNCQDFHGDISSFFQITPSGYAPYSSKLVYFYKAQNWYTLRHEQYF